MKHHLPFRFSRLLLLWLPLLAPLLGWKAAGRAATLTVTNKNDNGAGSLRQTIASAASGDAIGFASGLSGTITLTSGELPITKNLAISGPATTGLTISGNHASRIFNISSGTVTLARLTIANGSSNSGGGLTNSGTLTLLNCTLNGNMASRSGNAVGAGGAIANDGTLKLTNCTLSGNSATGTDSVGGAIINNGSGVLTLLNCTLSGNSATFVGGGIISNSGGTANVANTILAGNSAGGYGPDYNGDFNSQGYNLIGNEGGGGSFVNGSNHDQVGTGTAPLDPKLGPLQANGGPTFTLALLTGSPAIDAGNDTKAPATDQRGVARNGSSDIGAFELSSNLSVNDASMVEGNSASETPRSVLFTVNMGLSSTKTVTVHYATSDGTATAGSDYTATAGTLTFAPGETSHTIAVPIVSDTVFEADETFLLTLSAAANAPISDGQGIGTIVNDDQGPPTAASQSVSVTSNIPEAITLGASDPNAADVLTFHIVSLPAHGTLSVGSQTVAIGTIKGNQVDYKSQADYVGPDSFSFYATDNHGNTSNTATVSLNVLAGIIVTTAQDITANDSLTSLREAIGIAGATSGRTIFFDATVFATPQTITLDSAGGPLVVNNSLGIIGPAAGVTVSGGDAVTVFTVTGGTVNLSNLTIAHGRGSSVVAGGLDAQGNSTITLTGCTLANNTGGAGAAGRAACPNISNPGGPGGTGALNVGNGATVTLINSTVANNTGGTGGASGLNQTGCGPTASAAGIGGAGGLSVTGGTLTLINSTIALNTGGSGGRGIFAHNGNGGTGGVADISGAFKPGNSIIAGNTGGTSPSGGSPGTAGASDVKGTALSQGYNVIGKNTGSSGFANGAKHDRVGTDAAPLDAKLGPLQDNGGPTQTIALLADSPALNAGETTLATDQRGIARPQGNADDVGAFELQASATIPSIKIDDVAVIEGNSGTVAAKFTVTLSTLSTKTVTVQYYTSTPGSMPATADVDYVAVSLKTLTFAPGVTSMPVVVQVNGDTAMEGDERFVVTLKNSVNATIADREGFGTIRNDDGASITIDDATTIDEGNKSTKSQVFTVHLSAPSTQNVSVDWATAYDTADSADFVAASGTVVFAPGTTSKVIVVQVKGDKTVEPTETYKVNLSNPKNGVLADSQGVGTIRNDDAVAPPLSGEDAPSE